VRFYDVPEAEARACPLGLKCIHDTPNTLVILESDSAIVIEAIKKRNQDHSRVWKMFDDINDLINNCCRVQVAKIGRESNNTSHVLADVARLSGQGKVPIAVADIVESEAVKLDVELI
jgi:ribonuclease HI